MNFNKILAGTLLAFSTTSVNAAIEGLPDSGINDFRQYR